MKRSSVPICFFTLWLMLGASGYAGPLKEAKINQIVNDVKVIVPQRGPRPAALQEVIKDDLGVHTGVQSRAELLFQDNTLTRLGAETFFSFKPGTRDLNLERGTLLLQVPKSLGGARIRAASVTASITGTTIMMEHLPSKSLKVVVLEGSLRLGVNGRLGENMVLTAGKMVIMNPGAKRVPEPVDVDLRKLVRTSALIDPSAFRGKSKTSVAVLPSMGLIEKEISHQEGLLKGRGLVATNLVIAGSGTSVVVASDETLSRLDTRRAGTVAAGLEAALPGRALTDRTAADAGAALRLPDQFAAKVDEAAIRLGEDSTLKIDSASREIASIATGNTSTGGVTAILPTDTTSTTSTTTGSSSPSGSTGTTTTTGSTGSTSIPPLTPIAVSFDTSLPSLDLTGASVIAASSQTAGQTLNRAGADGLLIFQPGAGGKVDLRGPTIDIKPSGIAGVDLSGGNGVLNLTQAGGSGGILAAGTELSPISGDITVSSIICATTGDNSLTTPYGGAGGAVQLVSKGSVTVSSTVKVSDSAAPAASAAGGTIAIKISNGINVTSTGELLSLLAAAAPGPGGTIKFVATGGDIKVEGKVQADRGTVEMGTTAAGGKIELKNAAVSGDVVKIGALGANGELIVGGGTINADTTLKLYAGTTDGAVRFKENVTLGGASTKTIAGRTVTIDNGRTVTIGGTSAANVFTDRPNYTGSGGNGSTTGKFGGAGATTKPYAQTPAF